MRRAASDRGRREGTDRVGVDDVLGPQMDDGWLLWLVLGLFAWPLLLVALYSYSSSRSLYRANRQRWVNGLPLLSRRGDPELTREINRKVAWISALLVLLILVGAPILASLF